MKTFCYAWRRATAAAFLLSLIPLTVAAQTDPPPTPPQGNQGPMVVERVRSGFVVAPDFKVTEFDKRVSGLAGAYGGWLADQTFLVGGGGYFLTNQSRDRELAYGGFIVGWLARADRRIGFGVKGLVGGGEARLLDTITILERQGRGRLPIPVTATVRLRDDFFVAEPEGNVLVNLNRHLRLTGGVGYRLVAGARDSRKRLQGTSGSVALQISGS